MTQKINRQELCEWQMRTTVTYWSECVQLSNDLKATLSLESSLTGRYIVRLGGAILYAGLSAALAIRVYENWEGYTAAETSDVSDGRG